MITKIANGIYKLTYSSNIFYLSEFSTLIDAGDRVDRNELLADSVSLFEPSDIKQVIFTHLHYDHIGNFDMFTKANFFASGKEIKSLEGNRYGTVLDSSIEEMFNCKLKNISSVKLPFDMFLILETPGHTIGNLSIFDKQEKILFSGDTLFDNGNIGRTDLPNSVPAQMKQSLQKLKAIDYKVLAPGHDY
jgi:glyoxylase-like metal-dependent hydrolase (beta-lactamase superfamily II)